MRRMRHLKPREIQGCQLALDASIATSLYDATSGGSLVAANGAVARWEDQSGNGYHVTQSTAGARPARRVSEANGFGALEFDGGDSLTSVSLNSSSLFSATSNTFFAIVHQQSATARNALITADHANATGGVTVWATYDNVLYADFPATSARTAVAQPSNWDNQHNCLTCWRDGGTVAIRNRGAQLISQASKTGSVSYTAKPLLIGTQGGGTPNPFDGYMSCVAIYNRSLDIQPMMRMEHALMRKARISG